VPLALTLETAELDRVSLAREPLVAVVVTHPSNPLGHVYTEEELRALRGWARRKGLTVIAAEMHACSLRPGETFVSAAECAPAEALSRTGNDLVAPIP